VQDLTLIDEKFAAACTLYAKQDYKPASQICRRLILEVPNFAKSYHMLGLIYLQQKNFSRAINYLIRASVFADGDVEITYNLAYSYHRNQQRDLAIQYYQKVLLHCPEHKTARFNLACALNETGQNSAAVAEYQQAINSDQGYINALYNIAKSYQRLNRFTKASKFYLAILEFDAANPLILNNLGRCFWGMNNLEKAHACFLEALQHQPNNSIAYNNIGELCILESNLDLALKCFLKAIKHSAKYKLAWLNLAKVYRLTGDLNNSTKCYNKIIYYYPDDLEVKHFIDVANANNKVQAVPLKYLQDLHDLLSYNYEKYLCKQQEYQVPQVFKNFLEAENISHANSVLDLGCGTGLMAVALNNTLSYLQLTGIDLSRNMLEIAKKSNLYTDLHIDDINNYLLGKTKKYDLILAADVLVYQGCLKSIFQQIANCMHQESRLCISVEMSTAPTYRIKYRDKFGHNINYIQKIVTDSGLEITKYSIINIRQEYGVYIPGYCLLLKKLVQP
jgi:predicted TPR repeat methyltransferase